MAGQPIKEVESKDETLSGMVMLSSFSQFSKARSPTELRLRGRSIVDKLRQSPNAYLSMLVTLCGMTIDLRLEQYIKVVDSIHVIVLGSSTETRLVHP